MTPLVRLLGSRPVAAASSRLTVGRLRVLAYHQVGEPEAFARQLDRLSSRYATVTGAAVADWLDGTGELPARPVWITFDDADPSVVHEGARLLAERGMVATMFVCPGVVDTCQPHWWDVVGAARSAGITTDLNVDVTWLKRADDTERRRVVESLAHRLEETGQRCTFPQVTTDDLHDWAAAGHEVGNHTWDHPCLDRCAPAEQRSQIHRAHEWLTATLGQAPNVFAWPNGDPAGPALAALRELGYRLVLEFDHRVCVRRPDPMSLSRLRVDADADLTRFDAIISGAHPSVFALARALRRRN